MSVESRTIEDLKKDSQGLIAAANLSHDNINFHATKKQAMMDDLKKSFLTLKECIVDDFKKDAQEIKTRLERVKRRRALQDTTREAGFAENCSLFPQNNSVNNTTQFSSFPNLQTAYDYFTRQTIEQQEYNQIITQLKESGLSADEISCTLQTTLNIPNSKRKSIQLKQESEEEEEEEEEKTGLQSSRDLTFSHELTQSTTSNKLLASKSRTKPSLSQPLGSQSTPSKLYKLAPQTEPNQLPPHSSILPSTAKKLQQSALTPKKGNARTLLTPNKHSGTILNPMLAQSVSKNTSTAQRLKTIVPSLQESASGVDSDKSKQKPANTTKQHLHQQQRSDTQLTTFIADDFDNDSGEENADFHFHQNGSNQYKQDLHGSSESEEDEDGDDDYYEDKAPKTPSKGNLAIKSSKSPCKKASNVKKGQLRETVDKKDGSSTNHSHGLNSHPQQQQPLSFDQVVEIRRSSFHSSPLNTFVIPRGYPLTKTALSKTNMNQTTYTPKPTKDAKVMTMGKSQLLLNFKGIDQTNPAQLHLDKQKLAEQRQALHSDMVAAKSLHNVVRHEVSNGVIKAVVTELSIMTNKKVEAAKTAGRLVCAPTPHLNKNNTARVVDQPLHDTMEHEQILDASEIPQWATDMVLINQQQKVQAMVDADQIFIQPRHNWCKLEQVFAPQIQHYSSTTSTGATSARRHNRARGSSARWEQHALSDKEIHDTNKLLGIFTGNY